MAADRSPQSSAAVLVVEDDRALRESLAAALDRQGFEVRAAPDGAAGVQLLREDRFDVVLLDIGLPFVDGWHVMSTLPIRPRRRLSPNGDSRLRFLSLGGALEEPKLPPGQSPRSAVQTMA